MAEKVARRHAQEMERAEIAACRARCEQDADSRLNQASLDAIWAMAWETGHSSGLSDVEYYWDDFHGLAVIILE